MRKLVIVLIGALLLTIGSVVASEDSARVEAVDSSEVAVEEKPDTTVVEEIVVYYLHGNRRCATCRKLETYSEEAVLSGFAEQLEDSIIVWQVVNYEEDGNEHYLKDYQLYTKAVVLSRIHNGKEVEWKNLDRIWKLVGDKDEFIAYVQEELHSYIAAAEE